MSKILGKNVLRTSAFAMACLALVGVEAKASGVSSTTSTPAKGETFSTVGSIGTSGVTNSGTYAGPGPVGFSPVTSGSFGLNSNVSLGAFTVSTISDGSSTTYKDTPFTITYNPLVVNGDNYTNTPITITGKLNGTVDGSTSSVVATFDPIKSSVFQTSDSQYLSSLSVPTTPLLLVPSTTFGGLTSIEGSVVTSAAIQPPPSGAGGSGGNPQPTPEPTTLAILATSLVGFGLRQRLRLARKAS